MNEFSRRNFLKGCGLAATISLTSAVYADTLSTDNTVLKKKFNYTHLIYDETSDISKSFAKSLKAGGKAKMLKVDNDISDIYFKLTNSLKKHPNSVITGLSSYETFFVMQNLLKDYGFVLFHSGTHTIQNGAIKHEIKTSASMSDKISKSLKSKEWQRNLATNLSSFVLEKNSHKFELTTPNKGEQESIMCSWIMASKNVKGAVI
ncbi:hypothetical protein [Campylobacter sp. RM16192]|uniref:hypothetical protein n=1 Tax=Campylobacter sp. RM16192 TaxID=1660080 RepID=UPI00145254F4|nr:hypothetical protein [Campylobacter sp. RM16192]QCD51869.1 hypothetical protein CDOMC_0206 [Campylobacter sp. RM16192]